ncbi:MAG TPA: twin-arginine translocase subunit TatC, partial [Acidimicrobiia bacterium]
MSGDQPQSILAHLDELRWRVFRIFIAVAVGGLIAFFFADQLRSILEAPFHAATPDSSFQSFEAAEEFGVLMRIALFGGVILASPVILYQLWAFINPALTARERRWAVPIVSALVVLFVGGVFFGYFILPQGLRFLLSIVPDVRNDLRIGSYYSFVLRYLAAFGLAFL